MTDLPTRTLHRFAQLAGFSPLARCARRARRGRRDRGDVPGWVLITVMTAGLVTALWLVAGPALADVFTSAVTSVKGP